MTEVAFLGLGIMGSRQAVHLARAGHDLTVYNRTTQTAEDWAAEHGARVAPTPREAAAAADVVFSMVVDGDQVASLLLDAPDGAVHGARENALFVDMSTIAPSQTRAIGAQLAEAGVRFVDAPVTGSAPKAADGTLTIMTGGEEDDVAPLRPLLECMGETIVHVGGLGQGEMAKLINNSVAAANAALVAQALVVGQATGVDLDALVEVIAAGSGGSKMLDLKAGPMRAHDYTTLFKLEHMLKDVRLCLEEAQAAGVPFPGAAAARDQYVAALGRGLGEQDFAAVLEAIEGLAGVRLS
ncbi:MAG: 3-hydroxyisobutyrate dehydrogenase [Solirubrobacteraceae bacterium]|jgi:3-hydroxyisobutyrate dehydrogenase-like beta-hydroxyacid dehydrogenase|nr:3-hydroxyisobutyrate dehydrogenase [Solirubrobacteraceae bacterium]